MNELLRGITVLDLSSLLPAPFATHLLAKMGARVIKIESPTRPDPGREFGFVPPGQPSSHYREINGNKELVWLNLKDSADRAKLYALVKEAHAAIEGYRPEVKKRLGIEYETLREINPALVYCSAGGYHPKGRMRDRAGHDINFVARSGIQDQTRDRDGRCVPLGAPVGDYLVAYSAALRIVSALLAAGRSGQGCHLEISIEETLLEVQMPFFREALDSGDTPRAGHTLVTGRFPCYRLYQHPGGVFALGALESKFWEKFCQTIGRAHLIPFHFATGEEGKRVADEIEEALRLQSFETWLRLFEEADCCIEPVLPIREVLNGLQSS